MYHDLESKAKHQYNLELVKSVTNLETLLERDKTYEILTFVQTGIRLLIDDSH